MSEICPAQQSLIEYFESIRKLVLVIKKEFPDKENYEYYYLVNKVLYGDDKSNWITGVSQISNMICDIIVDYSNDF